MPTLWYTPRGTAYTQGVCTGCWTLATFVVAPGADTGKCTRCQREVPLDSISLSELPNILTDEEQDNE